MKFGNYLFQEQYIHKTFYYPILKMTDDNQTIKWEKHKIEEEIGNGQCK